MCQRQRGKKLQDIAKEFGIPPNTLSTLIKNEEKIHASSPGDKRVKNRPPKFSALKTLCINGYFSIGVQMSTSRGQLS